MKILIAVSDRDFLSSFSRLLTAAGYETDTAADGARMISKLAENRPDIVLLERSIPRIGSSQLLSMLDEKDIPSVELTDRRIVSGMLVEKFIANAYLSLPFLPYELPAVIEDVMEKKSSSEVIKTGEVEADVGKFLLCKKQKLCAGELDIIKTLSKGTEIGSERPGAYINSLNIKIERLNLHSRIKYITGEGYRLVKINE